MQRGDAAAETIALAMACTATEPAAARDVRAAAYRIAHAISTTRPAGAAAWGPVGIHGSAACKPAGVPTVRSAYVSTDGFGTALVREPVLQRPAAIFAATACNGTWTCTTGKAGPTSFAATTGSLVTSMPSAATRESAGSTGSTVGGEFTGRSRKRLGIGQLPTPTAAEEEAEIGSQKTEERFVQRTGDEKIRLGL